MRGVDERSISEYGIPELLLMENAGERIFQSILSRFPMREAGFLIGRGNNGGDGLVIARKMFEKSIQPTLYILAENESRLSKSSQIHLKIIQNLKIPYFFLTNEDDFEKYKKNIVKHSFLIDALLGTGINQPARGLMKNAIEWLNQSYQGNILAIDVPSGLCTERGFFYPVLKAHATFTVEVPKINLLDYPGKGYAGHCETVKIGFPKELIYNANRKNFYAEKKDLRLPERKKDSHKGSFGKLLLLAGSEEYAGAPQIAINSALKTGAGLIYYHGKADQEIRIRYPEAIVLDKMPDLNSFNSIIAGPGWGKLADKKTLEELLSNTFSTLILDADALNELSKNPGLLRNRKNTLLTPHLKEFGRMINKEALWIKENKIQALEDFYAQYPDINVLLKDTVSLFSHQGKIYTLPWGSPALARGGSGDLLAGLIGGFCAYFPLFDSVLLSCYLNGRTAEILSEKFGDFTVTPSLIAKNYHLAIKEID